MIDSAFSLLFDVGPALVFAQADAVAGENDPHWITYVIAAAVGGLFLILLLATCVACLRVVIFLPQRDRPAVPWTGWSVAGLLFLFVFCQTLGAAIGASLRSSPAWEVHGFFQVVGATTLGDGVGAAALQELYETLASRDRLAFAVWPLTGAMLGELTFLALMIAFLRRGGATWDDLGLGPTPWLDDAHLARTAFFGIIPVSLVLQGALVKLLGDDARQHPLIEMLRDGPPIAFWIASGLTAVVVAPIVEELAFRVLVQGWLKRKEGEVSPNGWIAGRPGFAPLLIASAIFAAIHANAWPAPIPLFFVALVLGRLYDATGRVAPSIALHMALNGFSFTLLLLATLAPSPEAIDPTVVDEPTAAVSSETSGAASSDAALEEASHEETPNAEQPAPSNVSPTVPADTQAAATSEKAAAARD